MRSIMEFPLAKRELTQAGRDRRMYILRAVLAGAAVVILWLTWMIRSLIFINPRTGYTVIPDAEIMGQSLAITAQFVQFVATFLVAPVLSAGLICTERQEGTLGLLLMADLSGRDVFLAKFLRAFLLTELLLVSMLPLSSFASILGGISVPDIAARLLVLNCYAAAVCALGLFFSSLVSRPAIALFLTTVSLLTWLSGMATIEHYVARARGLGLGPLLGDSLSAGTTFQFVLIHTLSAAVVGLSAAALTIFLLPRRVEASPPNLYRRTRVSRGFRRRLRRLSQNPVQRIIGSGSNGLISDLQPWPLRLLVFLFLCMLALVPCVGGIIIKTILVYDLVSALCAARRNGQIDELVTTPVRDSDIAFAIFKTAIRSALFYGAAIALAQSLLTTIQVFYPGAPALFWFPTSISQSLLVESAYRPLSDHLFIMLIVVPSTLAPFFAAACAASIASYVAFGRGSAVQLTTRATVLYLLTSASLTFFFWLEVSTSEMDGRNGMDGPIDRHIQSLLNTTILSILVYGFLALALYRQLADNFRSQLLREPEASGKTGVAAIKKTIQDLLDSPGD